MHLTVKGKHLDIGDSLREYVEENLNYTAQKYFTNPIEATVVFSKEKQHLFSVDISIHLGSGIVLQAQHESNDPYPAFDIAAKTIGKRLSRYKDKLKDHSHREPVHVVASYSTFQSSDNVDEAEGGSEGAIIAETETKILTLAVADAVMRLELSGKNALLFKTPGGKVNMVYRRKDGNIGWVEAPTEEAKKAAPKKKPAAKKKPTAKKKPAAKKASPKKKAVAKKPAAPKKATAKKKPAAKKTAPKKKAVAKKTTAKKAAPKKKVVAKKKPAAKKLVAKSKTVRQTAAKKINRATNKKKKK